MLASMNSPFLKTFLFQKTDTEDSFPESDMSISVDCQCLSMWISSVIAAVM